MRGYNLITSIIDSDAHLTSLQLDDEVVKKVGYYFEAQARKQKNSLYIHNNKIGLQEWFINEGSKLTLRPDYLNQFMRETTNI